MKFNLLLILFFIGIAHAQNDLSGQEVMAISKIAGACGIFNSMAYFQKATKMAGGEEFMNSFWNTEATRLGISLEDYIDKCNRSIEVYDNLWETMETIQ